MSHVMDINFKQYSDGNGTLCVYENASCVPFNIQRVFTVSARVGDIRGQHAHKECTQLLICVSGEILVGCDDGVNITEHRLDNMGAGLLIPPGIWAKEEYLEENTVLMVLCDRVYEADDYIRDYKEFKYFARGEKL